MKKKDASKPEKEQKKADLEEKNSDTVGDQNEQNKNILRKLRFHHIVDINMMRVFLAVLFIGMVVALIPGIRPSYSDVEKRDLTKFPKITLESLASGEFFDDVSLWYSDTFPFRENLVQLNGYMTGAFGKNDIQIHGSVEKGDEIPDADTSSSEVVSSEPVPVPEPEPEPQPVVEQLGAMLIIDNTAYEYYNFNQSVADAYSAYISRAADMLAGKNVYDILIPTSLAITAPEKVVASISSSDQKKAIDYMFSRMSGNVKKVELFDVLKKHRDEYIYFRTDHHWTALGAYYAYRELMAAKGVVPAELAAFNERRFEGFLGSFYAQSGQKPQLGGTPDTVIAYEPMQVEKITTVLESGATVQKSIIANGDKLSASNKYLSFVCGDHPFGHIYNPQVVDNSVCIVVKESFGNAFVPFLTQNYTHVYVVDYRHFSKVDARKLSQLVTDAGAQDIIFINNLSATRNSNLVTALGGFIG